MICVLSLSSTDSLIKVYPVAWITSFVLYSQIHFFKLTDLFNKSSIHLNINHIFLHLDNMSSMKNSVKHLSNFR